MKAHAEALKRRWADPVYREKQVAVDRRTAAARKAFFADPLNRARHTLAIRAGMRMRKR